MTLATDRALCEAVPTVARAHDWREDKTCGATANLTVEFNRTEHHICAMHSATLGRAIARDGLGAAHRLFASWGWS